MAKMRWWAWARRPGTVPEGDYEVDYFQYGFELEVIDSDEETFGEHPPRRGLRLVTSKEIFESWAEDNDELSRGLLKQVVRVYGRPLRWADHQWYWDRYAQVMVIPLIEC